MLESLSCANRLLQPLGHVPVARPGRPAQCHILPSGGGDKRSCCPAYVHPFVFIREYRPTISSTGSAENPLSEADLICSIALSRGAAVAAFQRIKAAVIPAGRVSEFAVWRRG
ncbi:conserved hypothetical protein [Ricinus communis]|uniref:Uncharacterized protein n=1 Tax=Ricinus communis TaxID=3988 RepID=B9T7H2_RICCO|nr:conserved hypothetical protein [Ricinus communis]